jgi:hypothetical protein
MCPVAAAIDERGLRGRVRFFDQCAGGDTAEPRREIIVRRGRNRFGPFYVANDSRGHTSPTPETSRRRIETARPGHEIVDATGGQ